MVRHHRNGRWQMLHSFLKRAYRGHPETCGLESWARQINGKYNKSRIASNAIEQERAKFVE